MPTATTAKRQNFADAGYYMMDIDPESYTNQVWYAVDQLYREYWEYWTGRVFEAEDEHGVTEDGSKPKLYPIEVNLAALACETHSSGVVGDTESMEIPIEPKAKPRERLGGEAAATFASEAVKDCLELSGIEGWIDQFAILQQVFGGCYLKVAYEPPPRSEMGVEVQLVWPQGVYPTWSSKNCDKILEIMVVRFVGLRQAEISYNVSLSESTKAGTPQYVKVTERWSEKEFEVIVGDGPDAQTGRYMDGSQMAGKNPYGFVPYIYIPRARSGDFFGDSLIEPIKGIQDEVNARLADVGDAVSASTHQQIFVKNRQQGANGLIFNHNRVWNLGMNPAGQPEPEVGAIDPPTVPSGTKDFIEELMKVFRLLAKTPPVIYGIDEGSQRSALTLAFRMYPYTNAIQVTRRLMVWGFKRLSSMILSVMAVRGLNGVTEQHAGQMWAVKMAPVAPRDREQLVNEIILLLAAGIRSPEKALEMLGDVAAEEIESELELAQKFAELRSKIQQQFGPKPGEGPAAEVLEPKAESGLDE